MTVPVIALTSGDPAGIGPEIAVKARALLGTSVPFVWIGDPRHLPDGTAYTVVSTPQEALTLPARHLPVLPHAFAQPARPGQPVAQNAHATIAVIERATALVQSGAASALCTAPINKSVLKTGASFAFPGHTEFLAHLAGVDHVVMMLVGVGLRTVPVTIHCALADVPARLTLTFSNRHFASPTRASSATSASPSRTLPLQA